jgi:hypothetical protein
MARKGKKDRRTKAGEFCSMQYTKCTYYAYCEIMALPQFVLQYVDDIFQTSLAFLSQTSQASTEIQR